MVLSRRVGRGAPGEKGGEIDAEKRRNGDFKKMWIGEGIPVTDGQVLGQVLGFSDI